MDYVQQEQALEKKLGQTERRSRPATPTFDFPPPEDPGFVTSVTPIHYSLHKQSDIQYGREKRNCCWITVSLIFSHDAVVVHILSQ